MEVKKGRVLGLVFVGPLRSLGVGVPVVSFSFFLAFFSFFFSSLFLYISLSVGILFAVNL